MSEAQSGNAVGFLTFTVASDDQPGWIDADEMGEWRRPLVEHVHDVARSA